MLFDSAQLNAEGLLDAIGSAEAHKHSAGYLEQRNKRLFDAIALMLGYGIPVDVIARRCGVGENTVRAVSFRAAGSVEDSKRALKENLRKFLHGASLILVEKLDEIPVEKLPAALAAINQQLLLLDGQATSITRHETAGTLDDVAAQITAAQEAARQARGRVVDEAPETGLVLTNNPPGGIALTDVDPVGQLIARLAADPAAIDGPTAPVAPLTARLVITKSRIRNPKIVLAKKEGAAPAEWEPAPPPEIVRVNVRNNAKLRPGMILEACTPLDVEHGYWEYRGKLPKKPRHTW